MSSLGVADAVVQLVAHSLFSPIEVATRNANLEIEGKQLISGRRSNDGAKRQLVMLVEEGIRTTLQSVVSKALLVMPFLLSVTIHLSDYKSESSVIKPEPSAPL